MSIGIRNFTLPLSDLSLKWELVGEKDFSGGRGFGLWVPGKQFEQNTTQFLHNRFLDIGTHPHYLWLFKEYLQGSH